MRKNILILSLQFFFANYIFSQVSNSSLKIIYNVKHLRDTNDKKKFHFEEMSLVLNANESRYYSNTKQYYDSIFEASASLNVEIPSTDYKDYLAKKISQDEFIYNYTSNKFYFVYPRLGINYIVESKIDEINWQLIDSSKIIKNLICQQAKATFKGRQYTAWFCNDIPYKMGPWKLNGLPGLIIEAFDSKLEVFFELSSIEKSRTKIEIPTNSRFVTKEELAIIKNKIKSNPAGFMQAAINTGSVDLNANTTIDIKQGNEQGLQKKKTTSNSKFNNPLELKD